MASRTCRSPRALGFVVGCVALAATPAQAAILFDFNALGGTTNASSNNAGMDTIDTYMSNVYGSTVKIAYGARTRRSNIDPYPDYWLGNTDGATSSSDAASTSHGGTPDTFLINRWNSSLPNSVKDRIVISFLDEPIYGLEVDWEIFPVVATSSANADLTIKADGVTIFFHELLGAAKALGAMGHFSYMFAQGVTTLEFIDWFDAPVGIDNLTVTQNEPVPEPATLGLLALGLAVGGYASSRKKSRRS